MSVLLGSGSGSFGVPVTYSASVSTAGHAFASADFNNDGNIDLLTGSRILLGTGSGTFLPQVGAGFVSNPYYGTIGHFNSDSNLDLAYTCYNCSSVSVLLSVGSGSFASAVQYSVPTGNLYFFR